MLKLSQNKHIRRAVSAEFTELKRAISHLREQFIPDQSNPTGLYDQRQELDTYAFVVLAHAEVEAYLEDRVKRTAISAKRHFDVSQCISHTLGAMLAYTGSDEDISRSPKAKQLPDWLDSIQLVNRVEKATNRVISIVGENHGIRESNFCRLIAVIGISPSNIDPKLIRDLDQLGAVRGTIAHTSMRSNRLVTTLDPFQQLSLVEEIVVGLVFLDRELHRLDQLL